MPRLFPFAAFFSLWFVLIPALAAYAQIDKLPHPDTTSGNFFGVAVSIDGDRALVGASGEDVCGDNAGAAYVFERDSTNTWTRTARLTPSVCLSGEFFGRSVALSGNRALIAASADFFASAASNAAYLFERDTTGTWKQVARLTVDPSVEEGAFAASVALDGDRAVITTWGDPSQGQYGGAAYVFEPHPRTGRWEQVARLAGSRGPAFGIFGGNAVLDGDRLAVAASTYFRNAPGSVYIFERDAESERWEEVARFGGIDDFFISLALDADRLLVGESKAGSNDAGAATVYVRDTTGTWQQQAALKPLTPYDHGAFGSEVALKGDRALIAGYDEQLGQDFNIDRVVYVFAYDVATDTWKQQHIVDIGEVAFGTDVDIDGSLALIGRAAEQEPGAAYVVRLR